VSDADISRGKDMKEEPSDELTGLERHGFLFILIGIVSPAEEYITVLNLEDTIIADSDPVGISAEIFEDALGAVERRLAVDNPFLMIELPSEDLKGSGIFQMPDTAGEYQLT
jgi:hypothetical protein